MILSKDNASGMPWLMPELPEEIESLIDCCLSSPLTEALEEDTREGRRYPSE